MTKKKQKTFYVVKFDHHNDCICESEKEAKDFIKDLKLNSADDGEWEEMGCRGIFPEKMDWDIIATIPEWEP